MKGLILKDLYCVKSYFRAFFLIELAFIVISVFAENASFFMFYPCVVSGIIAMSLIAYEEKEKCDVFAETLPVSRGQIVSVKYIISLIFGLGTVASILILHTVLMIFRSSFDLNTVFNLGCTLLAASLIPTAILTPLVLKFGAEKGRIFYYIVLGAFFGAMTFIGNIGGPELPDVKYLMPIVACISVAAFAVSFAVSVSVYKKKEF